MLNISDLIVDACFENSPAVNMTSPTCAVVLFLGKSVLPGAFWARILGDSLIVFISVEEQPMIKNGIEMKIDFLSIIVLLKI